MARLISSSIQNLLNGISQQPDSIRLDNQGAVQENGLSDVVYGLGKRPPTEHIAKLNNLKQKIRGIYKELRQYGSPGFFETQQIFRNKVVSFSDKEKGMRVNFFSRFENVVSKIYPNSVNVSELFG